MNWTSVEAYIERCRITGRVNDTILRQVDPDRPDRGVALIDRVKARFDLSDQNIAEALGVHYSAVSRYRLIGVPGRRIQTLRKLQRMSPDQLVLPRRIR